MLRPAIELCPGLSVIPCTFEAGRTINVCLFSGQRRLLVDAGVASTPADCILPALQARGLSPRDLDWLICLHAHADHLGGIAALAEASAGRLRVGAHVLDARAIADHRFFATLVNGLRDEARIAALLARCGPDVRVDVAFHGGEVLDLGGLTIEVLHAPGHTAGNLSLFERTHGALVHGESVMRVPARDADGRRSTWHLGLDPVAYRDTLERLRALPFEWFIPSHEAPMDRGAGQERIADALAELDEFEGHVRQARARAEPGLSALATAVAAAGQYVHSPALVRQVEAVAQSGLV